MDSQLVAQTVKVVLQIVYSLPPLLVGKVLPVFNLATPPTSTANFSAPNNNNGYMIPRTSATQDNDVEALPS